jgi:hypothetical protein
MLALSALLLALVGLASPPPTLSPSDQAAIMKVVCDGELLKDAAGWLCRLEATDESGQPLEERWVSARQGRFVAHPDEWLVSLSSTCIYRYCPAEAHVVRKVKGTWRRTHEIDIDAPLGEDCVQFGGMEDGLERLACLDATGPNQGFMSERLTVLSLAGGKEKSKPLMQKDQGGECFLSPPLDEHQDDILTIQRGDVADPQVAFTMRLQVRRAACDPKSADYHGPLVVKSEHVLAFFRSGNDVVPDAASARIINAEGWSPAQADQ